MSRDPEFPALPVTGLCEFLGRHELGQILRLLERLDLHLALAWHAIGGALRPDHRLVHVLDFPDREAGDEFLGLGERPVDEAVSTGERNTYLVLRSWSVPGRKPYHRVGFTAAQSTELWERWKKGAGVKSIARALGKSHSCIVAHMYPTGGIRPASRRRSRLALTLAERGDISRGAKAMGRAPSITSREWGVRAAERDASFFGSFQPPTNPLY